MVGVKDWESDKCGALFGSSTHQVSDLTESLNLPGLNLIISEMG